MFQETKIKLHAMLEQEFGVIALESDMDEIEHIVCADDLRLLNIAQAEIRSLYDRVGIRSSNLLVQIDQRLSLFPPTVIAP